MKDKVKDGIFEVDLTNSINNAYKYLKYNSNDFIIQKGDSSTGLCLYKRIPGTPSVSGQATLSGTLSYTIKIGESLTEDQIKSAARVLYRSNEKRACLCLSRNLQSEQT